MRERLNYKSRKTIIIVAIILLLIAIASTGIYMFTKGNDETKAFTEGNTTIGDSEINLPEENKNSNSVQEPTIEPEQGTQNNNEVTTQTPTAPETTKPVTGTTTQTTGNVPNEEYVTEKEKEVEKLVSESFLVGWTPINVSSITEDIQLNKPSKEAKYEVTKVATLVNGEAIKNENGEFNTRVKAGDKVTYVITVKNTGNVTIQNIKVVDELANYEETISVLEIGESKELTVIYEVKEEDMTENDTIINTVKVSDEEKTVEGKEEIPSNPAYSIPVEKIWNDNNNQDGKRQEVTICLYADGEAVEGETLTLDGTTLKGYFENVLKYNNENKEIKYTVKEETQIPGYETTYSEDTFTITNTHIPETTTAKVTKVWNDSNNQDGIRPESITVQLQSTIGEEKANVGEPVEITPNEDGKWEYEFTGLTKYANGELIKYTVKEETQIPGYETTYSEDTFTITNTHIPETTTAKVTKVWNDSNNQDGIRPESITVQLQSTIGEEKANVGEPVEITPNEDGKWEYEFTGLTKYANGELIKYSVEETTLNSEKYQVSYETEFVIEENITTIVVTNTHTPETTSVKVTKQWSNENNTESRPNSVIIALYNKANKEVARQEVTGAKTVNNTWTYEFTNLPKYVIGSEGVLESYSIKEIKADGKTIVNANTQYDENYITTYSGTKVINTFLKPNISVVKAVNEEIARPGDILTYTITAKNTGNKEGKVTIKDTVPEGTILEEDITLKIGNNATTKLEQEKFATEGYEITVPKNTTAIITFKVKVNVYAGNTIENIAKYTIPGKEEQETKVSTQIKDSIVTIPTEVSEKYTILLLDTSGSMNNNTDTMKRIDALKQSAIEFATKFLEGYNNNKIKIITIGNSSRLLTPEYTNDINVIKSKINEIGIIQTSTMTNIDAAFVLANKQIKEEDATKTSIILMTDGIPNWYQDENGVDKGPGHDGLQFYTTTEEMLKRESKEYAFKIKERGAKVYSLIFGINQITTSNDSQNKVRKMLQEMSSGYTQGYTDENEVEHESTYVDGYYYEANTPSDLTKVFLEISKSIDAQSTEFTTELNGENLIINQGINKGQIVELYVDKYIEGTEPEKTFTWEQFIKPEYITYDEENNTITMNLVEFMKANDIEIGQKVYFRFR